MSSATPDRPTIHRTLWGAILLALLAMLALASCTAVEGIVAGPTITPTGPSGTRVDPPLEIPAITLTGTDGEPVSLSDFVGEPTLIYFGYTYCPDVCPLSMADFAQVARLLADDADQANFVFVSVDPARDTPERLADYVPAFNPDFIGLTPADDEEALETATQAFGVYYEYEEVENTAAGYLVAHTSSSFLLDPEGRLAVVYAYQMPPDVIAADMQAMIDQS